MNHDFLLTHCQYLTLSQILEMNTIMPLIPLFVLTYFHIFTAFAQNPTSISHTKLTEPPIKISNLTGPDAQFTRPLTLITGKATISSPNKTFKFCTNDEYRVYLGIWYASIPSKSWVSDSGWKFSSGEFGIFQWRKFGNYWYFFEVTGKCCA